MREIKFRGKRIDNTEWIRGGYIKRWNGVEYKHYIHDELYEYEVDRGTVGQYTGLNDKNGKEIYEDDIIRHHGDILSEIFYNSSHCAYLLKDVSGNRNKCICDKLGDYSSLWIEVIGNIHDNPELLEGAE